MTRLMEIYDAYVKKAVQVRKKASPFAGFFGLGDDPRKHACHEMFYEAVEEWANGFDTSDPDRTLEAVRYIFQAPEAYKDNKDVYWFMYAAHGLTQPLLPGLRPEDRAALAQWYNQTYPKRLRFPVQNQVYKCLQK